MRRIPDKDSLFRHAVYPASFKKKVFANESLWHLTNQADGSILGSLAWQRFEPTASYVHQHGCRLSRNRNERARQKGTYKEDRRNVYCGFFEISAERVRGIPSDPLSGVLSADVIHHIEENEIAHTDLRFRLHPDESNIEAVKTAIAVLLWNRCTGPQMHVCECDTNVVMHPNGGLEITPLGEYEDTRSWGWIVLGVVRFRLYRILWLVSKRIGIDLPCFHVS